MGNEKACKNAGARCTNSRVPTNLMTSVKNHSVNHPIYARFIFYDALITVCF